MADHYNNFMFEHDEFVPADGENIYYYDARDEMPLYNQDDVEKIFDSEFFFDNVTIKEGAVDVLTKLKKDNRFNIILWSYGSEQNIARKSLYVKKKLDGLYDDYLFSSGSIVKKSSMFENHLIIDDHQNNLKNKRAFNICFADRGDRDFNIQFNGVKVESWEEVYRVIIRYMEVVK